MVQAMMELGACVCTVHQPPDCKACPIQGHCGAYTELQDFLLQGGKPSCVDAPQVIQYPAKVSHCNLPEPLNNMQ